MIAFELDLAYSFRFLPKNQTSHISTIFPLIFIHFLVFQVLASLIILFITYLHSMVVDI